LKHRQGSTVVDAPGLWELGKWQYRVLGAGDLVAGSRLIPVSDVDRLVNANPMSLRQTSILGRAILTLILGRVYQKSLCFVVKHPSPALSCENSCHNSTLSLKPFLGQKITSLIPTTGLGIWAVVVAEVPGWSAKV